jgi:hypothetical protein
MSWAGSGPGKYRLAESFEEVNGTRREKRGQEVKSLKLKV